MKFKNNENGYALLMVILLVLLFTTLGMGLLAMNINASKQFNVKEDQVQARHLAEMGILHFQAELEEKVNSWGNKNIENICDNITGLSKQQSAELQNSYWVTYSKDLNCLVEDEMITITVMSTGDVSKGQRKEELEAVFVIKNKGLKTKEEGYIPIPTDFNDSIKIKNEDYVIQNGIYSQEEDSLYVKNNLKVENGNSDNGNDVTIKRNLFIDGDMNIQNHACFAIQGDLIVKGNVNVTNKVYIFVYGDAYFNSYDSNNHNNDIYVSGKVYINGSEIINPYQDVPTGNSSNSGNSNDEKSCPLPGSGNPSTPSYSWELLDKIDVDYFIDPLS